MVTSSELPVGRGRKRMSIDAPRSTRIDITLLYIARGVRGLGDGFAIIILPAYLSHPLTSGRAGKKTNVD